MSQTVDKAYGRTFVLFLAWLWPLFSLPLLFNTLDSVHLLSVERDLTCLELAGCAFTVAANIGYWWYFVAKALPFWQTGTTRR